MPMSFLQEVNGQKPPGAKVRRLDALDLVLRGTQYEAFHRAPFAREYRWRLDAHNLVTLSRFPFGEVRQMLHAYVPPIAYRFASISKPESEIEIRWERPLLLTVLELPGHGLVHVVNLHLRAPLASPVPVQSYRRSPGATHPPGPRDLCR